MMLNHYGFEPKARPVKNSELWWIFLGFAAGAVAFWFLFDWILRQVGL
jgi:hypothetical protein